MDNWDELRVFLAVAREGTLAKAGEVLGLNQSTVFRRVAQLERSLSARLVERRGRGYMLTVAGEQLVAHAERVEAGIFAMERELQGTDRALSGTVRLTAPDTLAMHVLGPILSAFRETYAGVHLDLLVGNRFFALDRGEAEVALRPGKQPTEDDVIAQRVCGIAGAFYASTCYMDRMGRPAQRSDLDRHELVGVDETLAHIPYAVVTKRIAPDATVVARSSSLLAQAMLVERGLGIAALPCFLLDRCPNVVRLFDVEEELQTSLWLLLHGDLRNTARVRTFVDFLFQALSRKQDLFEGRCEPQVQTSDRDPYADP